MAFEDFLRSIPLVHKHIMRTRRLIHENMLFRKFLERNGLSVDDVLSEKMTVLAPLIASDSNNSKNSGETAETLQTLVESLRAEQIRAAGLESDLYVLQIDYDDLLTDKLRTTLDSPSSEVPKNT